MQNIQNLIHLLQSAISPLVLISGLGLLLLTFTNRLARVIDRSRFLVQEIQSGKKDEGKYSQIRILIKRAKLLQTAITLISITILSASLMILLLFIGYYSSLSITVVFIILFVLAVIALIAAVIFFLFDISLTLKALNIQTRGFCD